MLRKYGIIFFMIFSLLASFTYANEVTNGTYIVHDNSLFIESWTFNNTLDGFVGVASFTGTTPDYETGNFGNSIKFSGDDYFAENRSLAQFNYTPEIWSIVLWVYPTYTDAEAGTILAMACVGSNPNLRFYDDYSNSEFDIKWYPDPCGSGSATTISAYNLPRDTWTMMSIIMNNSNSTLQLYYNTTLVLTSIVNYGAMVGGQFLLGQQNSAHEALWLGGQIDNLQYYNTTLSDANITAIYEGNFDAGTPDTTAPEISIYGVNMTYNDTYNHNINFNASGNEAMYCNLNDSNFEITSINTTFYSFNESALSDGFYAIELYCADDLANNGTTIIFFTKDLSDPTISSYWNQSSFTNRGNITINITFEDNIDLWSVAFNISNGTDIVFNNALSVSPNTTYTYINVIDTTEWGNITYNATAYVCDSHTDQYFTGATDIKREDNLLAFTFDDVKINITSSYDNMVFNYKKLEDRYTFNTQSRVGEKNTFFLTSNEKLKYLPYSRFSAHFIVQNKWIDFAPYDTKVTKISDYSYKIEVLDDSTDLSFNSIGELNCISETWEFTLNAIPTYTYNYSASLYLGNNGWFNDEALNTSTTSGVMLFIFIFLILVGFVVLSEVVKIPVFMILTGLCGFFVGIYLYVTISSIIGVFVIVFAVLYMLRGVTATFF